MRKIFLALAMIVATLMPVASISTPASAHVAGCSSHVQYRADTWATDYVYMAVSRWPSPRKIRGTGTVVYLFCPNGAGVNKVKPMYINWCYSHLTDWQELWFDGMKFNAYIADDNSDSNPPQARLRSDGTVQNCMKQNISAYEKTWLRMDESPFWTVSAWVVFSNMPDQHFDFRRGGFYADGTARHKFFRPYEDPALSGWL